MTIPRLPMVGGIDLGDVGGAVNSIRSIFNPNLGIQTQLRAELIKNPELKQKLIDLEAQNPGTIRSLFGKQAEGLGQGMVSAEGQQAMYDRDNASKPIAELAKVQTPQSEALLRKTTGANTPTYDRLKSEATTSAAEATAAPAKAAYQKAEAVLNLHLLPDIVKEKAAELADKSTQRGIVAGLIQHYKGPAGVVNAIINDDPNMPEEGRNAAFKDEGLYRQINEAKADQRMKLTEKLSRAREGRERESIIDQMDRHDAQNKADLASRLGQPAAAKDLYDAGKLGLDGKLDNYIKKSPEELQALAQTDPVAAQILQHPTMLQSWKGYKDSLTQVNDKEIVTMRKDYDALVNKLQADAAAKKIPDESAFHQRQLELLRDPYHDVMEAKGMSLPLPKWDSDKVPGEMFHLKTRLYFVDGKGNPVEDPSAPIINPEARAKKADELHAKYPTKSANEIQAMVLSGKY